MKSRLLAACLAAALAPGALDAQAMVRADSVTLAAMRRLEFLIGDWQGTGTLQRGPGNSSTSNVRESAHWRLDGAGILVQGHGTAQIEAGGPEVTVHDALAVITYDKANQRYRFQAWRGDGEPMSPNLEVGDRRMVWSFQDPRGFTIRFTMQLTPEGRWNEVGEASRDGTTWFKFMEMNLDRVPAAGS